MKSTKLIKVIQAFSKPEMKRLKEFVHSPFFRASKSERDLFDFIYKYAPDFEHKKFTQEQAHKYVFANENYEDPAIIKVQSRLVKLVEQFIYYYFSDKDLPDMEVALMRFYDKNNLSTQVESVYKRAVKKQMSLPYKNSKYFYHQLLIEERYNLFLSNKFGNNTHYQKVIERLDIFYLTKKLTHMCEVANRRDIIKQNHDIAFEDEVRSFISQSAYKDIPTITMWYSALQLFHSKDKYEHYHQLKTLLVEHNSSLDPLDKRTLYKYLENNTRKVFESDAYYEALFDLYSKQLENEVIYIDGYLLPRIFKNIVTVALRLGHLDWTAQFLENNKNKIMPEYEDREDVYSYSLAQLRFKQQKIDDVLDILNRTIFNDIYTKMDVRRMYLKVYYEMEYADMLEDMVNSFRVFLTSQQDIIPAIHIQAHRDFINIIYSIYRTIGKDTKRITDIEKQIGDIRILPEKSWLLEKLSALK